MNFVNLAIANLVSKKVFAKIGPLQAQTGFVRSLGVWDLSSNTLIKHMIQKGRGYFLEIKLHINDFFTETMSSEVWTLQFCWAFDFWSTSRELNNTVDTKVSPEKHFQLIFCQNKLFLTIISYLLLVYNNVRQKRRIEVLYTERIVWKFVSQQFKKCCT